MWVEITNCALWCIWKNVILLVRMWVEIFVTGNHLNLQKVILLVRMWVEIFPASSMLLPAVVILLVRMWVEMTFCKNVALSCKSSSLWGCELKYERAEYLKRGYCHPPCEDVSWNIIPYFIIIWLCSHPPCEDVSWNTDDMLSCMEYDVILLVRMWVEIWKG